MQYNNRVLRAVLATSTIMVAGCLDMLLPDPGPTPEPLQKQTRPVTIKLEAWKMPDGFRNAELGGVGQLELLVTGTLSYNDDGLVNVKDFTHSKEISTNPFAKDKARKLNSFTYTLNKEIVRYKEPCDAENPQVNLFLREIDTGDPDGYVQAAMTAATGVAGAVASGGTAAAVGLAAGESATAMAGEINRWIAKDDNLGEVKKYPLVEGVNTIETRGKGARSIVTIRKTSGNCS